MPCWKSADGIVCTKKLTMKLIGIKSRATLITYCRHLGFDEQVHSEEQIEQLFLMSRWIRAGYGKKHSRASFCRLRRQKKLRHSFASLGINIDQEITQLHRKIGELYDQGNTQKHAA